MPASSVSRQKRLGVIGGIAATVLLGAVLIWCERGLLGQGLAMRSYDLPFFWREAIPAPDVVIVYLDREAQQKLAQADGSWDRSLHTRLLKRLTDEKAALVFFD